MYIFNRTILFIVIIFISLTCEDKKNNFQTGNLAIEINFNGNGNSAQATPVLTKSYNSSVSISKVIIELESNAISPVEINVSGSSVSRTINNIPAGPDVMHVKLYSSSGKLIYEQSKSITIIAGSTISPTFNSFTFLGILREGFEGDVTGWRTGSSGGVASWAITDYDANSGSNSAYVDLNLASYSDDSYIVKTLSTPRNGTITVEYYFRVSCSNNQVNSLFGFYASGNNSSTSSQIYRRSGASTSGWQKVTSSINLNAFATPIDISWGAEMQSGSGECRFYLDDILVY